MSEWFMRLLCMTTVMVVACLGFTKTSASEAVAFQINPSHDGAAHFSPALTLPLTRRWQVDLGGQVSYPLIADGKVFVVAHDSDAYGTSLIALDEATGEIIWGPISLGSSENAAYDGGKVFVVNDDGLMQAFGATDGNSQWSALLPNQYSVSSPPTAANGIVYTGGAGAVYALDESNGALLWEESVKHGDSSSPAIGDGAVYVSYPCQVYAFAPDSGDSVWHYDGPCEGGGGTTPAFGGNRLYVRDWTGSPEGFVFDAQTGSLLWQFDAQTIPAIGAGTGFFLQSGGTLRGISLDSETVLWSFAGDGQLASAPIIVDDHVLIGSQSGTLYVLDAASGHVQWSTQVGAPISSPGDAGRTGLGAGDGIIVVPASSLLTAYASVPDEIFPDGFESP